MEHRVRQRAHLVFQLGQRFTGLGIDDCLEAVLMLIRFFGDQPAICQPVMRSGEICDIDGDVVGAVV